MWVRCCLGGFRTEKNKHNTKPNQIGHCNCGFSRSIFSSQLLFPKGDKRSGRGPAVCFLSFLHGGLADTRALLLPGKACSTIHSPNQRAVWPKSEPWIPFAAVNPSDWQAEHQSWASLL